MALVQVATTIFVLAKCGVNISRTELDYCFMPWDDSLILLPLQAVSHRANRGHREARHLVKWSLSEINKEELLDPSVVYLCCAFGRSSLCTCGLMRRKCASLLMHYRQMPSWCFFWPGKTLRGRHGHYAVHTWCIPVARPDFFKKRFVPMGLLQGISAYAWGYASLQKLTWNKSRGVRDGWHTLSWEVEMDISAMKTFRICACKFSNKSVQPDKKL